MRIGWVVIVVINTTARLGIQYEYYETGTHRYLPSYFIYSVDDIFQKQSGLLLLLLLLFSIENRDYHNRQVGTNPRVGIEQTP